MINRPPESIEITEEIRKVLESLNRTDPRRWSFSEIAGVIRSVTDRAIDSSGARRFVKNDPVKAPKFNLEEAIKLRQVVFEARDKFENLIKPGTPPMQVEFQAAAHYLDIRIPVSEALFEKSQNDPALKEFIRRTVENALEFAAKYTPG